MCENTENSLKELFLHSPPPTPDAAYPKDDRAYLLAPLTTMPHQELPSSPALQSINSTDCLHWSSFLNEDKLIAGLLDRFQRNWVNPPFCTSLLSLANTQALFWVAVLLYTIPTILFLFPSPNSFSTFPTQNSTLLSQIPSPSVITLHSKLLQ